MISIKQKLTALFMILSFSVSMVPVFAISGNQVSSYVLNEGQSPDKLQTKLQLVGDAKIKNGSKRVSVSLRDSNVKQALRMFADKAGLNIIFHDSVEDKSITLDLVGVTLQDAIRMVMQASDLSYFVDSDTLIIMSAEESKKLSISKQNMMILPVKYSDATDIAKFLNTNIFTVNKPGLSNTEIVAVDPAKNQLVIFGTQSDFDMAKKALEMLDTPVRVTNFKVNHVTPREMSKNICMALIKGYSQDDKIDSDQDNKNSNSNSSNSSNNNNNNNNNNNSSSSGSGSSGKSSGLSSGSTGGNSVELGKARLACVTGEAGSKAKNSGQQKDGALYSLNRNGIKVMYYETLGLISVIGGSQDQLDTIAAYISATDIKQPMAYLEFSIIELSEDGMKDFEARWSFLSQNFSVTFDNSTGSTTFGGTSDGDTIFPMAITTPDRRGYNKYHGTASIQAFFNYIIENKKGKTLANPKIIVTSGKESVIDLSKDYLKTMKATTTVNTAGATTSVDPQLGSDEGIIISVTPFISKDGYVVMNLAPTYSIKGDQYTRPSPQDPNTMEIVATGLIRRDLTLSNIRVKDGDTLILGGLIQESNQETVRKIPILGDLPLVGVLFRGTKVNRVKQELVILITPHIISDSDELVTTGEEKTNL